MWASVPVRVAKGISPDLNETFSPGLRHEPGLKGAMPFSPGSYLKPGLKGPFKPGLMP